MTREDLRASLFRCLTFEAEAEVFRQAGIVVGTDISDTEKELLDQALAPFGLVARNEALQMSRLYALLFCFENSVRELIRSVLSDRQSDWWESLVPSKTQKLAESRRASAQENSWLDGSNSDLLTFVDFGGLSDIILNSWDSFTALIPSQHWLKQRFDELEKARNYVAHNRMLSQVEFERIEMYVNDWNRQVGI